MTELDRYQMKIETMLTEQLVEIGGKEYMPEGITHYQAVWTIIRSYSSLLEHMIEAAQNEPPTIPIDLRRKKL